MHDFYDWRFDNREAFSIELRYTQRQKKSRLSPPVPRGIMDLLAGSYHRPVLSGKT